MTVRVEDVMNRAIHTCAATASIAEAAETMASYNCGILPVVSAKGKPVGVVTDRDLCLAVGTISRPAGEILVQDVMSREVRTCRPGDEVVGVLKTMASARIHRLPVLGERGTVCGILSLSDVLRSPDAVLKSMWEELLAAFRQTGEPVWEWESSILQHQENLDEAPFEDQAGELPFPDRAAVARKLVERLSGYRGARPLVLGIPRRAVRMARIVADGLEGEVDMLQIQKLTAEGPPVTVLGSVSETGHAYVAASAISSGLGRDAIRARIEAAHQDLLKWREQYTPGRRPPDLAERTVIVVSDGMVTGASMISSLRAVRAGKPARVVVAIGAATAEAVKRARERADEVVALAVVSRMESVASCYREFSTATDEEVIAQLNPPAAAQGTSRG